MSRYINRLGFRPPSAVVGEVTVDVTPVMNMFIILIPFLVSMAAFSHLAVHRFSLPASEGPGSAQTAADLPLTVALTTDQIAVARGEWILASAPRDEAGYDFIALADALRAARTKLPELTKVVVAVDDPVVTADVVTCLDHCRAAGFADVGVAAGTNLDR